MAFDPKVSFGVLLTTHGLMARGNNLTNQHRLKLMEDTLLWFREDARVVEEVLIFVNDSKHDQPRAGRRLLDFTAEYFNSDRVAATEAALTTIERESPALYDWQKRADCYG